MKFVLQILLIFFCSYSLNAQNFENLNFEILQQDSMTGVHAWKTRAHTTANPVQETIHGQQAMQLSGSYTSQQPGYFYQHIPFTPERLIRYKISAYIRCENVEKGSAGLYAYGKRGQEFINYADLLNLQGTQDWKRYSLEIWLDERVDHFRIGGQLTGSGSVWFDQFSVEEIPFSNAPLSTDAQIYLDSFFHLLKTQSLYRDSIDIDALKKKAALMAAGGQTSADCYSAMRYVIDQIDHHSFMWTPEQVKAWQSTSSDESAPVMEMTSGHLIGDHYAYLSMPHCGTGDSISETLFADSLHQLLERLDSDQIKGWVLDLRNNGGGNCWPMLSGIGPLLGEGICGYFIYGDEETSWFYKNGKSGVDDYAQASVSRQPYQLIRPMPPVAVLTGPLTGSSGEVVTGAFVSRPRTKSFGQPTAGYCTANTNFTLSDSAMVFLATSIYADRNKNLFDPKIYPDQLIEAPASEEDQQEDQVLRAALEWLRTEGKD